MATVRLERITKAYPNGFEAVHPTDLEAQDGEMVVLVGPSGCGKTTMLRMVAGLERPTSGDIWIGDQVVTHLSPKQRNIAMVFQDYALYPHMTVGDNIGFALKLQHTPKEERVARVLEVAKILGLAQSLDRKPGQLSGGQRQRVAMGRAIVREPTVFLMDEPLSNLDAQLRVQMRAEVSRIQKRLGVTTLYVTHDQVEAMTMGDRVAVIRDGTVQQCDSPQHVYEHPANMFVAAFIGSPAMNLYAATLADDGASIALGSQQIALPTSALDARPSLASYRGKQFVLGIRPEEIAPADESSNGATIGGTIDLVEALGSEILVHFSIEATRITPEGISADTVDPLARRGSGVARLDPRHHATVGESARFSVDVNRLHFFAPDTGEAIA